MLRYKLALKLLLIFVLLLPLAWVLFDDQGKRWLDVTLLGLRGNPSLNLDFAALNGNEQISDIRRIYPKLELECAKGSETNTEHCFGHIAAFNRLPARFITFFFGSDGRLQMIKLNYRTAYHEDMAKQLTAVYGEPRGQGEDLDQRVLSWRTGPGQVVVKVLVAESGDNQLFWLSPHYHPEASP
jgi:hypothetical protein